MSLKTLTKVASLAVVLIAIPLAASAQPRVVRVGPGARTAPVAVTVVGARPAQRVVVRSTLTPMQRARAAQAARAQLNARDMRRMERARDEHRAHVAPPPVVIRYAAPPVRRDIRENRAADHGRDNRSDARRDGQRFDRRDRPDHR